MQMCMNVMHFGYVANLLFSWLLLVDVVQVIGIGWQSGV